MNLKTSNERVNLLKKGFFGNDVERLYLAYNDIKLTLIPIKIGIIEIEE